jgi:putative colanic acid biosynthesis UDP-glucose lipid carrier transferase
MKTAVISAPKKMISAASFSEKITPTSLGRDNLLSLFDTLACPLALIASLFAVGIRYEGELTAPYVMLAVMVFALTFPGETRLQSSLISVLVDICLNWVWIASLLLLTGYGTGYINWFGHHDIKVWLWAAPVSEMGATILLRMAAPALLRLQGPMQRAVIIGMNEQGIELAKKITGTPLSRVELCGFVDSRATERLNPRGEHKLLGDMSQIAQVIRDHNISNIYLSLPMASQPRILKLLDDLKDTTASIYFVPDMFVTDLIQGRAGTVCGTPVISVCETPFAGMNGVLKRGSDIVFSIGILLMIFPVLLVIAAAVKWTSPGPIIFKQRRYGLDGQEILVYKFRSMSVTENGATVTQATKNDSRITPLGAILRRTSLDELPQFINVLQGRMSIVGPRPHAVAHNEMYRKLIKGYMVRHKVKPGITGWAQINGFRGETETLDKMQGRIDYDLDYLRNWSLRLDVRIILTTVKLVSKDQQAY